MCIDAVVPSQHHMQASVFAIQFDVMASNHKVAYRCQSGGVWDAIWLGGIRQKGRCRRHLCVERLCAQETYGVWRRVCTSFQRQSRLWVSLMGISEQHVNSTSRMQWLILICTVLNGTSLCWGSWCQQSTVLFLCWTWQHLPQPSNLESVSCLICCLHHACAGSGGTYVSLKLFCRSALFNSLPDTACVLSRWDLPQPRVTWDRLMQNKNKELDRLNGVYMKLLNNAGVQYIEGRGTVVDAHTVEVNGKKYTVSLNKCSCGIKTCGRSVKIESKTVACLVHLSATAAACSHCCGWWPEIHGQSYLACCSLASCHWLYTSMQQQASELLACLPDVQQSLPDHQLSEGWQTDASAHRIESEQPPVRLWSTHMWHCWSELWHMLWHLMR